MANITKLSLALLIATAIGYGLGYTTKPAEIKEVTKIVEKIVENKNIKTTVTKKPDGSVTVVKVDTSTINADKNTDSVKTTKRVNLDWSVSAAYMRNRTGHTEIIGSLSRRIIGEVYVGVYGTSTGYGGIGVTVRF